MSRSTIHNELFLNDGTGIHLPIATGTFITRAINVDEHRRLSLTIGMLSSATGADLMGGFTGTLLIQGTDEIGRCNGVTGTPQAGAGSQPGQNGFTGALFWQTIPSGSIAINNATNKLLLSFTDVGVAYVRVALNISASGTALPNSAASGAMKLFLTAKNT